MSSPPQKNTDRSARDKAPLDPERTDMAVEPDRARTVWAGIWGLFLLLVILVAIVWLQRFRIVEGLISRQAEKIGIEAHYTISALSQESIVFENLKVYSGGEDFFAAQSAQVEFKWEELKNGHIRALKLIKPQLKVTIDEKGRITDSWLPEPSEGSDQDFLIEHIEVEKGHIQLASPYGTAQGWVDGNFKTADDFSLKIDAQSPSLKTGKFETSLKSIISLQRIGERNHLSGHIELPAWTYGDISGHNIQWDGEADVVQEADKINVDGDFKLKYLALDSDKISLKDGAFSWDGKSSWPLQDPLDGFNLDGVWSVDVQKLRLTDRQQLMGLAKQLALYEATSKSPVLQDFVPSYINIAEQFLGGSDVSGSGRVIKKAQNVEVFMDKPISVTRGAQKLTLIPPKDGSVLIYNPEEKSTKVRADLDLAAALPLTITGAQIRLQKRKDSQKQDVKSFKGRLRIDEEWTARTIYDRHARLGSMAGDFAYEAGSNAAPQFSIVGALDFDGTLPSGYGKGVRGEGKLIVKLGDNLGIQFQQTPGTHIQMDRYENRSEWVARNVQFDMQNEYDFFNRLDGPDSIEAQMDNVTGELANEKSNNSIAFSFARMVSQGRFDGRVQSWEIKGHDAKMTSDTLPAKGTYVETEQVKMGVRIDESGALSYDFSTEAAQAETDLVKIKNAKILGAGTADNVTVNYDQALVKFKTIALPIFPLTGVIDFGNAAWDGRATSYFPLAKETPIQIRYGYENGRGTADILVENLVFSRAGLQPQYLTPALKGRVADVSGAITAQAHISFGGDQPILSSGSTRLVDMHIGTELGPVSGVNADLIFSSFLPLTTEGRQSLKIKKFDPGIVLSDGEIEFEIIPDGIKLYSAQWPLGKGFIELEPTVWDFDAEENRLVLKVANVSLSDFTKNFGNAKIEATGDVSGEVPVVVRGLEVLFDKGVLAIKDGGVIRFSNTKTDAIAAQNEQTKMAFDALKNFHYDSMEMHLDGPLVGGDTQLSLRFVGANPDVLYGVPFGFNVNVTADVLELINSFKVGDTISTRIKDSILDRSNTDKVLDDKKAFDSDELDEDVSPITEAVIPSPN